MHKYETLVVLHPELGEAQVKESIQKMHKLIESMQGSVDETQEWGMRELAYQIQKLSRGYYALLRYTARPEVVTELERTLKIADEVLRFVSVRVPAPQKINRRVAAKRRRAESREATAAQEAQQGE